MDHHSVCCQGVRRTILKLRGDHIKFYCAVRIFPTKLQVYWGVAFFIYIPSVEDTWNSRVDGGGNPYNSRVGSV